MHVTLQITEYFSVSPPVLVYEIARQDTTFREHAVIYSVFSLPGASIVWRTDS